MSAIRFLSLLIATTLAFAGAAAQSLQGSPTERDPYCEKGQPPVGYGRAPIPDGDFTQTGLLMQTCEGEHWDGQDPDGKFASNPRDPTAPCTGQDLDPAHARWNVAVFQCPDPDTLNGGDPLHPIGVRVAAQGDSHYNDMGRIYVGGCAYLVGCTAVFAEGCQSLVSTQTGLPGTDGRNACRGQRIGDGTLAWYGKDHTPTNVLASALSALRISQGYVDDGDCTHDQYRVSDPNNPTCGRDNTAATLSLLF